MQRLWARTKFDGEEMNIFDEHFGLNGSLSATLPCQSTPSNGYKGTKHDGKHQKGGNLIYGDGCFHHSDCGTCSFPDCIASIKSMKFR